MLNTKEQLMEYSNRILYTVTGSHLYGTNIDGSDLDYQAVFIPDRKYVYGLSSCEQVITRVPHKDTVVDFTSYNVIKYIHLAKENNPNILSILFTPKHCIKHINQYGQALIDNRGLFVSKKAYHSFCGYAHAMKAKMLVRNPIGKRKELVEKYGFDTKYGMHLLRLLYEGLDIVTGGELIYPSPHSKYLLKVRNGEVGLDELLTKCNQVEEQITRAYAVSDLQYKPDHNKIEKLQMDILEDYWRNYGD